MNIWDQAKKVELNINQDISSGFDIVIKKGIHDELTQELVKFLGWVEENYQVPIMVLVDFVNNYYCLNQSKKRCGYLFYYEDFKDYPNFNNIEDLPYIILPCKGYNEKWSLKDIIGSLIDALTDYYVWLLNKSFTDKEILDTVEEIINRYFD